MMRRSCVEMHSFFATGNRDIFLCAQMQGVDPTNEERRNPSPDSGGMPDCRRVRAYFEDVSFRYCRQYWITASRNFSVQSESSHMAWFEFGKSTRMFGT